MIAKSQRNAIELLTKIERSQQDFILNEPTGCTLFQFSSGFLKFIAIFSKTAVVIFLFSFLFIKNGLFLNLEKFNKDHSYVSNFLLLYNKQINRIQI